MTRVHDEATLKTGKTTPQGAVNLACYSVRKPDVTENVQIASMVEKESSTYITATTGVDGILSNTVSSRFIMITDKFDEEPLYYVYTLKMLIRSATPSKAITIVSDKGYVPDKYKIQQELVSVGNGLYAVKFYTNFWADKVASFYAVYNGIDSDGKVNIGIKELINPQQYMTATDGAATDNTYNLVADGEEFKIKTNNKSQVYYVLQIDGGSISTKEPINITGSWYPRVISGHVYKSNPDSKIPEKMTYTVPDYYTQTFSEYGVPYIKITEQAQVVGKNSIKVKNRPVYAPLDDKGLVSNIKVTVKGLSVGEDQDVPVLSVDSTYGVIYVGGIVNPNDTIEVEYYYYENGYIYKGYTDYDTGLFVPLDLNPSSGHEYGYINEDDKLVIEPSFRLLNKTVYIYMRPSKIEVNSINVDDEQHEIAFNTPSGTVTHVQLGYMARKNALMNVRTKYSNRVIPRMTSASNRCYWNYADTDNNDVGEILIYNANYLCGEPIVIDYLKTDDNYKVLKEIDNNTIFHTTRRLSITEEDNLRAIMIAKIYVRPNSTKDSVKLIDTRSRGGGFVDMDDTLRMKINPETQYFMDIGCIDGEPLQENGVVIVKVDRTILKQYGGTMTESDVDNAINKYIALGVLAVVQYIEPGDHNLLI